MDILDIDNETLQWLVIFCIIAYLCYAYCQESKKIPLPPKPLPPLPPPKPVPKPAPPAPKNVVNHPIDNLQMQLSPMPGQPPTAWYY